MAWPYHRDPRDSQSECCLARAIRGLSRSGRRAVQSLQQSVTALGDPRGPESPQLRHSSCVGTASPEETCRGQGWHPACLFSTLQVALRLDQLPVILASTV